MDARSTTPWGRTPWFLTARPLPTLGLVARPRLFEYLERAISGDRLAIVAAPSGFGKTVLLSSWADGQDQLVAWLSVTGHETDDEELLLLGILSALERLSADRLARTDVPALSVVSQAVELRDIVGRIAATVAGLAAPVILIIDDAQQAGPVLGSRIVDVLIALTGGGLAFVIAGTPDILPWFAGRIARSPESVVTASALAMTAHEVRDDALARGEVIDAATAEGRRAATGGWPIALHLHRYAATNGESVDVGRDGLLVDFIGGSVLPALSPRMREFILRTTTCNRIDHRLAEALSGLDDCAGLLEECVTAGLFLERIDDPSGRTVYRWHDAFAEACRRLVARSSTTRSRELDVIAARTLAWRMPTEALVHAVRAGDPDLVLEIVRSSWIRIIVETGARALQHSCLSLPAEFADDPEILVVRACCLNLLGDRTGARLLAATAGARGGEDAQFHATLAFARLFLEDAHAELDRAADDAQRLIAAGATGSSTYAYRLFLLGWTRLRLRKDVPDAIRLLRTAMDEAVLADRPVLATRAGTNLLFALAYAGRFEDADRLRIGETALAAAEDDWTHYDGGIGAFALGFSAYWRGDIAASRAHFRALVAQEGHEESYAALGRAHLAFIAAGHGDLRELADARSLIRGIGRAEMHGVPWPVYRAIARADLMAAEGDLPGALRVVADLNDARNVPIVRLVGAEIARRAGDPALAMSLLERLGPAERAVSYIAVAAETTAALVAHERADTERARRRVERALDAAVREGIRGPFLAKEPLLDALLSDHAVAGTAHPEFVASLLAAREGVAPPLDFGVALSEREREVLGYLRTSMTAAEIAAALFVSVNTVRTHQRAIYRKLGVTSRRDAVRLRA